MLEANKADRFTNIYFLFQSYAIRAAEPLALTSSPAAAALSSLLNY